MDPVSAISLGMQAASGVTQALGIGQGYQRQLKQQQQLTNQQIKAQKDLADYQQRLGLEMWEKTNYDAQVKQLEKAGLNPALLYGKGGGGGATIGTGMQTGVSSSQAPAIGGLENINGMALQLAQIDLMKAQAENQRAEAEAKLGYQAESSKQQTAESIERTKGQSLENKWREWLQTPDALGGGQSPREREFRVTINKTISEITKIDEELKKLGIDISKGKSEIDRIKADTNLKQQAYDQLSKLNPMELQSVTKDLELKLSDPANTEQAQWIKMVLSMLGDLAGIGVKGAMTKSLIAPKKNITNIHNWGEQ